MTSKKSPNVYKSGKKWSHLKNEILWPIQKIAEKCERFGQKIVATGFEKLSKAQ